MISLTLAATADDKRGLEIWFIDTEGGAATLEQDVYNSIVYL